jgi:DtxR family Mn-dependent transcriptional regulator
MLSITEENYLKHILTHSLDNIQQNGVGTNELAQSLSVKPSSVNVMLKKLRDKELIEYVKYGKIYLTSKGEKRGLEIIRKHRLWETFLYKKLDFTWDEVHEVAEQLEHIQSKKLIEKLDKFLEFPSIDPHGDPIPDKNGKMELLSKLCLSDIQIEESCKMVAVKDNSAVFLKFVQELGLSINHEIKVKSKLDFDESIEIMVDNKISRVSKKFAQNILVIKSNKTAC